MDTFYLYLAAIFANWWAFMMAGPFIIDETIKWIFPKGKAWLERNLGDQCRRRIEVALMVFGVFLAGFLAFKDEHAARIKAETAGQNITKELYETLNDRNRKQKIRIALGGLLVEGNRLMSECTDESKPAPIADAEAWASKTENFFHENMDDSFIARFRNDSGLPMAATAIQSKTHRSLWGGILLRTYRLQEFIREYGN
jgi:hypothetical protein